MDAFALRQRARQVLGVSVTIATGGMGRAPYSNAPRALFLAACLCCARRSAQPVLDLQAARRNPVRQLLG